MSTSVENFHLIRHDNGFPSTPTPAKSSSDKEKLFLKTFPLQLLVSGSVSEPVYGGDARLSRRSLRGNWECSARNCWAFARQAQARHDREGARQRAERASILEPNSDEKQKKKVLTGGRMQFNIHTRRGSGERNGANKTNTLRILIFRFFPLSWLRVLALEGETEERARVEWSAEFRRFE